MTAFKTETPRVVPTLNQHGLPGQAESYWIASTAGTDYPALTSDTTVDVAIVGGGFVGIATAFLLKSAGLKVAVIEARRVIQGVTGYTTAKVTSLHRLVYKHLIDTFGQEQARQYAAANQAAIDRIESIASQQKIDCDFSRLPSYTFAESSQYLKKVEAEVQAAQSLGLPASFIQNPPLPFNTRGAVMFTGQAQFHPRKFLLPLASILPGDGSFVFEKTRVIDIEDGNPCTVVTDRGKIQAASVLIATNFPIHDKEGAYFARMEVMRSYVLGVRVNRPFAKGMFINAEEDGHSLRSQPVENGELLVIGGEDHVTGHESDTVKRYQELNNFVGKIFSQPHIEYSWSTQDNIVVDKAPYIGKLTPLSQHLFVATGFGQWGMSTSMAAAMILSDLIQNRPNPWADVFNPSRLKPDASAAKKLISQNLKVIQKLVGGKISGKPDLSQIAPGEGKVVEVDSQRAAAYRDENGKLTLLSPNCTHMGCTVVWNNAEKTWDCPCHGSRYDSHGEVIHSPTVKALIPLKGTVAQGTVEENVIARTSDLQPGQLKGIESQGHKIVLANFAGNYYAIGNICTHMGCLLSEGKLNGDQLQCHCHGSVFDIKTGEVVHGPAKKPEPLYQLKIQGDQILLIV